MTNTVAKHINDVIKRGPNKGSLSRPYVKHGTNLLLDEIMKSSIPSHDKFISTALRWDVSGAFRGIEGTWELVVDTSNNTILHFNFV